ncbi:MAG: hypothetical protein ACRCZ9_12080 [Fusobacteriaceae bacterium]
MLNLKEFVVDGLQERIVNEKVYEGRDMEEFILSMFTNNSKIMLLGHKVYVPSPLDIFMMDMEDVLHKTTDVKNPYDVECQVIRSKIHLDLNKTKMDILHMYFVINPNVLGGERRRNAIDVTRSRLASKIDSIKQGGKLDMESPAWRMLNMAASGAYHPDTAQDLFLEVKIYVPRLINRTYFLINNNRYYNGYYIKNKLSLTAKGELTISFDDEKFALLYKSFKEKILKIRIFKTEFNPFLFIFRDQDPMRLKDMFPDHFNIEKAAEPTTEYGVLLKKTYIEYEKMKNKGTDIDLDPETIIKHINLFGENEVLDVVKNEGENEQKESLDLPFEFKLNSTVYKETHHLLNKKILSRAMKAESVIKKEPNGDTKTMYSKDEEFGYTKMKLPKESTQEKKLSDLKRTIKFPPKMFLSIISTKSQFSKRSAANEIDIYELFRYITLMEGRFIADDKRKYTLDQLGVIDPIGTSQSGSVGINGQICYGVDDGYLK